MRLPSRQRGFLLNPFRFAGGGGGGSTSDLLLHFDGTNGSDTVVDSGMHGVAVSVVGASGAISTTQSRFGGASLGALSLRHVQGSHASIAFGTGDFTVECFVYWDSLVPANERGAFQVCTPAAGPHNGVYSLAAFCSSTGRWGFYTGQGTVITTENISSGVQTHVALARQSGVLRIFVGGTKVHEVADSFDYAGPGFAVGTYSSSGYRISGYVDEFRILAGEAAYTANFTPPAAPFVA